MNQEKLYESHQMLTSLGLGVVWVIGLWGFWTRGILALGLNASAFLLLLAGVLWQQAELRSKLNSRSWTWIAPLVLMTASYALYENPFAKFTRARRCAQGGVVLVPVDVCHRQCRPG